MVNIQKIKNELIDVCLFVYDENLVKHGEGNISIRIPNTEEMIITPSGNNYSNLHSDNMVHMNFDGKVISESLIPTSEFFLHRFIYQQRPKVNCIVHTHSLFASTLAVLHLDLPVIIEEMALFLGGGVKCAKYAQAGSEDLPKEALKAMNSQNAVLLANHGVLVVGSTSEYCKKNAVLVEKMSQIYFHAKSIGEVKIIPEKNLKPFLEIFQQKYSTI